MKEHTPNDTPDKDIRCQVEATARLPRAVEVLGTDAQSLPFSNPRQESWMSCIANWVDSIKDGSFTRIARAERELIRCYYGEACQRGIAQDLQPTIETVRAARKALASEPCLETERRPVEEGGLELEVVIVPRCTEEQLDALETLDLRDFLDAREGTVQVLLMSDGKWVGEVPIHFGLRGGRAIVRLPGYVTAEDPLYTRVVSRREGIIAAARVGGSYGTGSCGKRTI